MTKKKMFIPQLILAALISGAVASTIIHVHNTD